MEIEVIQDLFAPIAPVSVRRMFGGQGIWLDGVMFALVASGEIFLKSDPQSDPLFDAVDAEPFTVTRHGKPIAMSYRRMPEACFEDAQQLEEYAEAAIGAARRAASDKAKRPRRRPKPS